MIAHQARVVAEKAALDEKLSGLIAFFSTPTFKSLDAIEQSLMRNQAYYMKSYSSILSTRIFLFAESVP